MKITSIKVKNFLGARNVCVAIEKPVNLFCGKNFSGKSSLQEAIRMALVGESVRVDLKKNYGMLITEGADEGSAEVHVGEEQFAIILPSGKGVHMDDNAYLPLVLDAQRFSSLSPDQRRNFLFHLMGVKTDSGTIKERLIARECDAKKVEAIAPILRTGFETAHKEAQGKAREEKGAWRTITGETYGGNKAGSWKAKRPLFDAKALDLAMSDMTTVDEEIQTESVKLGDMQGAARRHAEQNQKLAGLREQAGMVKRITEKLATDEASLKETQDKVDALRPLAALPKVFNCPECDAALNLQGEVLVKAAALESDPAAAGKLAELEKSLQMLQKAVANDKRDLAAAEAAKLTLDNMESTAAPTDEAEIDKLRMRIEALKGSKKTMQARIAELQEQSRAAEDADKKTAKAAGHHASVQAWELIADALSPSGIPAELLAEALQPINDRLELSATQAEWPWPCLDSDMNIAVQSEHETPRPYALLSESEKWRVDAMIAEAISHISGVRLLVLDRFDVLDLQGREDLIFWLDGLAEDGAIDTALVFGTMKTLPSGLPERIDAFWIEKGVLKAEERMLEAA